jgi:hypothetical protein
MYALSYDGKLEILNTGSSNNLSFLEEELERVLSTGVHKVLPFLQSMQGSWKVIKVSYSSFEKCSSSALAFCDVAPLPEVGLIIYFACYRPSSSALLISQTGVPTAMSSCLTQQINVRKRKSGTTE